MTLPLPRSRRARLLAGVVVLAGVGAAGVLGGGVLGGGVLGGGVLSGGSAPAEAAEVPAAPRWLVTVDESALPEAPVPADAPVVHPEGPDGLLSLEQLGALDGASVVRDGEGELRVVHGDWRAEATTADRVAGLPGVESVEPGGEHAFLVGGALAAEQLAGLPGVVAVAHEDGSPVATGPAGEGPAAGSPAAEEPASGH